MNDINDDQTRELVNRWLDAFSSDDPLSTASELLHDDAEFIEHPNLISPQGSHRLRPAMLEGIAAGTKLLRQQSFTKRRLETCERDRVLVTSLWTGELEVDLGTWSAGTILRADVAALIDVADGKIRRQENWDCYHAVT